MKKIFIYTLIVLAVSAVSVNAENNTDSLSLESVVTKVINTYPALKKAEKNLVSVNANIGLTKTAYLPNVELSSSYSRIGPTTSFTMPGLGTLQLFPPDVYNATVSVNQNIYDFGRTAKNLDLANNAKQMVKLNIDEAKQKISMAVMGTYYSICFLQQAIKIKDEQLKTLDEHLAYIQKKAETGSATQYNIVSTKVRISNIENQKTDIQTSLQVQMAQLNSFLGNDPESPLLLKKLSLNEQLIPAMDSLLNTAYKNRYDLKIVLQQEEIAKSKLGIIKTENNPSLNLHAEGGYKNGYFNDKLEDVGRLNYAVGIGLKVPLFDANRSKYQKIKANAELDGDIQQEDLVRRNIRNDVVESRAKLLAAAKKIKQSKLQLKQAQDAHNLAEVNYKAGAITNLDLMDTYTALAQSELMLYKTYIDYAVNYQKLKISLGQKIW